jgi:hypothetical protein
MSNSNIDESQVRLLIRDAMSSFIDRRIGQQSVQKYVSSRYPWMTTETEREKKAGEVAFRCQLAQAVKRLAGPIADLITQELQEMDMSEEGEVIENMLLDKIFPSLGDEPCR